MELGCMVMVAVIAIVVLEQVERQRYASWLHKRKKLIQEAEAKCGRDTPEYWQYLKEHGQPFRPLVKDVKD